MALFTVVIPAYNGAQFIGEALESVYAQTLLPAEVIVVDDASSDDTPQIVRRSARHAPVSVRLSRQRRNSGGPAQPMNIGVQLCQSKYIATLDQDDRMSPNKVETALDLFARFPASGVAFGQWLPMDPNGVELPHYPAYYTCFPDHAAELSAQQTFESLLTHNYRMGGAGGMAFQKRAWQSAGGFDRRFRISWDFDFVLRLALKGWACAYAPTIFYQHRIHAHNLNDAEGGMRAFCENQRVWLKAFVRQPRLPVQTRQAILMKLAPELLNLAFWERMLGHYEEAVRAYLLALRLNMRVGVALRGLLRVAVAVLNNYLACATPGSDTPLRKFGESASTASE